MAQAVLQTGQWIENRYRVSTCLGGGGMGAVYRVSDEARHGRVLALKILALDTSLPGAVEDFQREFRILTQLRHPNLVNVFDYGVTAGGQCYFTMEYVEGWDLASSLAGLPREAAVPLVVQVCRALSYLHTRGVAHRDLKPSNILVVDGQVKLVDFGIAGEAGAASRASATGTIGYVAPEVQERRAWDHRSDLYSLGATWYTLLAGEPPAFMTGHQRLVQLALAEALCGEDERLEAVIALIARLMEHSPAQRYATANAVIVAINEATGSDYALETRETAASYALQGLFVGREAEMDSLRALWQQAQAGCGRIALVNGESGTGKTRLLAEFAIEAELAGAWVVSGQCLEAGSSAYQPWREALRVLVRYLESSDPPAMRRLGPVLATLIPELWQRTYLIGAQRPPALDPQAERFRLNDVIVQVLRRVAAVRPTLLILEDAQWADEATLELLGFLARIPPLAGLLVCLTYRDSEVDARHPLSELPEVGIGRIRLHNLSPRASTALVLAMLGLERLPGRLLERLQEVTAGNAFFVQELVRSLAEDGVVLQRTVDGWWVDEAALVEAKLPGAIRQVIERHLQWLPQPERWVLQLAAGVGPIFWDGIVAALAALPTEQVHALLDALRGRDMIVERESPAFAGQREFMFRHTTLHEVIYASLQEQVGAMPYAEVANWLVDNSGERAAEYAGLIGQHYERAGELALAGDWYERAGQHARRTYAPEAAVLHFRKALALLGTDRDSVLQTGDVDRHVQIYEGLGEVLLWRARYAEATEAFTAMYAAAEAAGRELAMVQSLNRLSEAQDKQGELRAALESGSRAEQLARSIGASTELVMALFRQGTTLVRLGESETALAMGREALEISSSRPDARHVMALSLNMLGACYNQQGNYDQASHYMERALDLFRELGDRVRQGAMLNNLGEVTRLRGDYARAQGLYQESVEVMREAGLRVFEVAVTSNLGGVKVALGDYRAAEADLRRVLEMVQAQGGWFVSETYRFLAEALLWQGRVDEALQAAQRALELGQARELQEYIGGAWCALGMVAANSPGALVGVKDRGEMRTCTMDSCFAESLRVFTAIGAEAECARTLGAWARCERVRGDRAQAEAKQQEARTIFLHLGLALEVQRLDLDVQPGGRE